MADIEVHRSAWVAHGILGTIAFGLLVPISLSIIILPTLITTNNYWTHHIRIGIDILTFAFTLCAVTIAIVTMSGMGEAGEGHVKEVHHIVGLLLLLLVSVRTAVINGLFQHLFTGIKNKRDQFSLEEEVMADIPYGISNGSRQSTMNINIRSTQSSSLFNSNTEQKSSWNLAINVGGLFLIFTLGAYQVRSGLGLFSKHYNIKDWGGIYLVYITSLVLGVLILLYIHMYKERDDIVKQSGQTIHSPDRSVEGSIRPNKGPSFIGDIEVTDGHQVQHKHRVSMHDRDDKDPTSSLVESRSPLMQTAVAKAKADRDFKEDTTRNVARELANAIVDSVHVDEENENERRASSVDSKIMQSAIDRSKSDREHLRSSTQFMTRNIAHALMFKADGDDAFREKEYEEAIEQYTQAIEIDDENCGYYSSRAAAYLKLGNHNNANLMALQDAMTAIKLGPHAAKGHCLRGESLIALGRYDDAVVAYKEGLEEIPNNVALQDGLTDARGHQYKWR